MQHVLRCHDFVKDDIVRADNCYLYDQDNNRYVDFESGIWCTVLGHANPRINKVITEQIDKVMHLGPRYTSQLAEQAATSLLNTISDKNGKCVFLSSGTEAVELGITVARLFTGRTLLLTLSDSYLGAYGSAGRKEDGWVTIDPDRCADCEDVECVRDCANLQNIDFDGIGAFVFEPGSSYGKVRFPPEKLIHLVAEEIRKAGGLIVVDEVTTGLGRTGRWYGFNHYGIRPDIVAFGKGLGNGYPASAVALKHHIAQELENRRFRYIQSHQNDPLGCAIAGEVIRIIREDDLVSRSDKLGGKLISSLNRLKSNSPLVREVRGRGLMASVQFSESHGSWNVESLSGEMLKRGFIIGFNPSASLIRFLPPLTIQEDQIGRMVENLTAVLESKR
jgi:acetylornithine/N-succinyldiaminopimelate aminotransferase